MTKITHVLLGPLMWFAGPMLVDAGEPAQLFREQVAPIFESRCVHCHGAESPKGGLSLTTAAGLLRGGKNGPSVVPGRPEESLLLDMVSGDEPTMPQKDKPLSKEQVGHLRQWIKEGARWPESLALRDRRFEGQEWWAFQPLNRPIPPSVRERTWLRNPIDAFVLARLEAQRLEHSAEADRRTLIRRLTFDLHGLPPTPREIDRFLEDNAPDAYEKLVDRLLASPRYGERWGRHWLDVVHYGDTHGYDKDKRRDHAWPYRDYVIRALNEDVPYDRFIREQIAGDILEPYTPRGVIATGFIAAGPWDFVGHVELGEQTVEKLKTRLIDRDDMVANTMSTFVSMTVHCARCHDHKFDPIPQSDYYRLQAVFAGVDRGDRLYDTGEMDHRRQELAGQRRAASARLASIEGKIAALGGPETARIEMGLKELRQQLSRLPRTGADPKAASPSNGYHSAIHAKPDATSWVQVDLGRSMPIEEVRLIPARPVDFADTPGFGFPVRFRVELADTPGFQGSEAFTLIEEERSDSQNVDDEPYVISAIGRSARFVRVTATRLWKRTDDYVFALSELEVMSEGKNVARGARVTALDSIEAGRWGRSNLVDGFDSHRARPSLADPAIAKRHQLLRQIQNLERARRRMLDGMIDPTLRAEREGARKAVAELDDRMKDLPPGEMVYAVRTHAPRSISVLRRGEVEQPGQAVGPGTLSCVPGLNPLFAMSTAQLEDEGRRRVALAEWIASPSNVLTWRSIANRVWHYHFGRGLVDTPNDFGRNGSRPTHPELLDWIAAALRDGGRSSLKALHRMIVCSAVYRQSSRDNPVSAKVDADNRLIWRMNRQRLDAEELRDSVLAVSGTLDSKMGGPGFALFRFKDDHSPIYDHTAPEAIDNPQARRRTIYRFVVRSVPNPFLDCMDSADPNINTPVRSTTITALQALALLNDLFIVKQSREFAHQLEGLDRDLVRQVERAFVLALGRPPRLAERDALSAYARKHGLANACRVLFNANEFLFID